MSLTQHLRRFLNACGGSPPAPLSAALLASVGLTALGCACPPAKPETQSSTERYDVSASKANEEYEALFEQTLEAYRAKYPGVRDIDFLLSIYSERGWFEASRPYQNYSEDADDDDRLAIVPRHYITPKITAALVADDRSDLVAEVCEAVCKRANDAEWSKRLERSTRSEDAVKKADSAVRCHGVTEEAVGCEVTRSATIIRYGNCGAGRRPAGLEEAGPEAVAGEGGWWATICWLEQAAVHAFVQLARELRALAAPADLIADATRAAHDEARHAQLTAAMARRHGVVPKTVACSVTDCRDVWSLARDNATEGCVREAFAAWCTRWQARRASDPLAASVLDAIGRDEERHGELSWRIHRWCEQQLSEERRLELRAMQARVMSEMADAVEIRHELSDALGLPDADEQRRLLSAFSPHVLAQAL